MIFQKPARCIPAILLLVSMISSCEISTEAKNHVYEDFDVESYSKIQFSDEIFSFGELLPPLYPYKPKIGDNVLHTGTKMLSMTVFGKMDIYETTVSAYPYTALKNGESVFIAEPCDENGWTSVYASDRTLLGYAKYPLKNCINTGVTLYADIPYETGTAVMSDGSTAELHSQLVDIRKYLRVCEASPSSEEIADMSLYDVMVSMKLATADTSAKKPLYSRNLCLMQYDTLKKFENAIKRFKSDGYTVVIYDAYRPTSTHRAWFEKDNTVPDPDGGMGCIHDRGTAVDISLLDANGKELPMPSAVYSFNKPYNAVGDTGANAEYMKNVMISCGFTADDTMWWHFQCIGSASYLPTDHPIDSIAMIPSGMSTQN